MGKNKARNNRDNWGGKKTRRRTSHLPNTGCGKVRYTSRAAALAAALLQGEKHAATLRAYRCRCGGWHLTTQARRTRPVDSGE